MRYASSGLGVTLETLAASRRKSGQIVAVLDIDSKELATFDEIDRDYLEQIVSMLYGKESQSR